MLTKLLNFFGIKTQQQKAEEYQAAAAKCPYMNGSNVSKDTSPTVVEVVTTTPPGELPTMHAPAQAAPVGLTSVTTIEIKANEPVPTTDTLTVNLTSDTIKFTEVEAAPAPAPAPKKSKSKSKSAPAKPPAPPAKITESRGRKKK